MAGLLEGFLPWLYGQSNVVKRNVRGLLEDPRSFAGSMVQDLEEQNRQRQKDYGLLFQPGIFTTPQEQQAAMSRAAQEAVNYVAPTVYHGSPHSFSKFDASKIGTGEGAQAYGHGLYFADRPETALSYKAAGGTATGKPENYAADVVAMYGGKDKALAHLRSVLPPEGQTTYSGESRKLISDAISAIEGGTYDKAGNLYKVNLPDEMAAKMLDYDKPLNQQAPEVRKVLKDSGLLKQFKENLSDFSTPQTTRGAGKGSNLLDMLSHRMGGEDKAAQYLRSIGIPGVRYLDQGSRDVGRGTSNYVVFSGGEDALSILERNGRGLLDR